MLESSLQFELDTWLHRLETLWKQKSREKWLQEGDANSRFFHLSTIIHARSNRISSIKNLNNSTVFEWDKIGSCFLNFYQNLFTTNYPSDNNPFPPNLDNLFLKIISDDDNTLLTKIPTPSEIKKKNTLFSFASNKSPDPDGLPPLFYKAFWKTTHHAIISAVQHLFKSGHLLISLNHIFIALIPKTKSASKVEHYRPISLCNVTYKIISINLANRLKPHLGSFISPFQMAFVSGMNIHDNNIVSHETMNYIHKKKASMAA